MPLKKKKFNVESLALLVRTQFAFAAKKDKHIKLDDEVHQRRPKGEAGVGEPAVVSCCLLLIVFVCLFVSFLPVAKIRKGRTWAIAVRRGSYKSLFSLNSGRFPLEK